MTVFTDAIDEHTPGAGVTIDGLTVKDGDVPGFVTDAELAAHESAYDHASIPTADQSAALALYETALGLAEAGQVLTASGPGAAGFAAVASGTGLSDFSNVVVVDAGGNGDYTTLGDAISAVGTTDLIVVFGSLSAETITISSGAYTIWLPSYRSNVAASFTINGASLYVNGVGRMTGTFNLNSGSLTLMENVRATNVQVNGGTFYGYNPYIYTLALNATAALRVVGAYISTLTFNADPDPGGSGSYLTHCFLLACMANEPRTNIPIFNCTFFDSPANVALAPGNYSNVAVAWPSSGANWPPIP